MSETQNLKLNITANDEASPVVRKLISEINKLSRLAGKITATPKVNIAGQDYGKSITGDIAKATSAATKSLRTRLAGEREINAVQDRRERNRQIGESQAMADFRRSMAFTSRMAAQRVREEREVERARARTEREHAAGVRRQIGLDRYRMGLRSRFEREQAAADRSAQRDDDRQRTQGRRAFRGGWNHTTDAGHRVMGAANGITIGATIGAGIVAKIAETGLGARSRADTAEANLRMFGGLSRSQVDAARTGWINRAAIDNGFRPADAINAFTEALKAGIPQDQAPAVTKSIMGASAGLDLNVADTTKLVGRLSTLTQDPKLFNTDAIDRMLNGIAVVAKVTAADSNELVSSLRRGAGVLGSSKMSVSDLTAFTGIGISTGMQEGKAGTFMDFLVNELVNAKNARGLRGQDLTRGFGMLGIGSNADVSRQAANDPTTLLLRMFERMSKMDPDKAGHVASLIGMREWRGEMLQMMKGTPMLRQTVQAGRDPRNANHLRQAQDERLGTLAGLRRQLVATFDLAWEAIGGGIEEIVREIGRFFLDLGKSFDLDVIKAHVKILIDGFVDGLGFTSITETLNKAFGKPDYSTVNSFFKFAQGFGQGVREVVNGVMGVVKLITGKDGDAGALGKWTARIIGFAFALSFLSPFVGILAGLGGAVIALGFALSKLGSIGSLSNLAAGLMRGLGLGLVAVIGANRGEIVTFVLDAIKSMWSAIKEGLIEGFSLKNILGIIKSEVIPAPVQRWLDGGDKPGESEKKKQHEDNKKSKKRKKTDDHTSEWFGLIQKQSFSGYDDRNEAVDRLTDSMNTMGARFQLASLNGPGVIGAMGGSGAGIASAGSVVSTSTDAARKFGKNFFTPNGMSVPGWYGGGGAGTSAMPPVSAGVGPYRNILDHIARSEGTAGRGDYNTSLGYGRFLPGGRETNLTGKTLNEVLALGNHMRRQPGNPNSSALGRYQIVGQTLRGLMRKFGLNGSEKFDEAMQDRMGAELVRQRGANARGLGQEWASLRGEKLRKAVELAGKVGQSPADAVTSGVREAVGGIHPLGGMGRLTSGFGMRRHPLSGLMKLHAGIDLAAPSGTPVKAMRDGVVSIGKSGDVTVKHPDGTSNVYRHVRASVQEGQRVAAGEIIAQIGPKDSRSTGAHLHLETRDAQGRPFDPKRMFGAAERAVAGIDSMKDRASQADGTRLNVGDGMTSTGWQRGTGSLNGSAVNGVPARRVDDAMGRVPLPPRRPAELGGGAGAGGSGRGPVNITVNGAGENPEAVAQKVQRRLNFEEIHYGASLEPELV